MILSCTFRNTTWKNGDALPVSFPRSRANGVLSVATFEYGRAFAFSYDHIIAAIGFLDFDAIYVPYIL